MSLEKFLDQTDDGVDPRVQVELERLNIATDEINKLEVDLDEARNQFRLLLQESIFRIDNCSKKLGSCIIKVRPYYDARIRAKEALQETQKAAVTFERANSAHAAAKEMVFLAEEGLKAEGRTFDHAWQEMLNHATMRVNESEADRTLAEAEHKRTSQNYQLAEMRVRTLQKELKRAITKSRPYYELKIHYTQLLEKQKLKVKNLEKQVTEVKLSYAQTLKNLERISDEIHKTRQKIKHSTRPESGLGSDGVKTECDSPNKFPSLYSLSNSTLDCPNSDASLKTSTETERPQRSVATKDDSGTVSPNSENDSSLTCPPDTESEDEIFKISQKPHFEVFQSKSNPCVFSLQEPEGPKDFIQDPEEKSNSNEANTHFEGVGICSFPVQTELNINFSESGKSKETENSTGWTEIKLSSPEEELFSTVKVNSSRNKDDLGIPYAPLSELEEDFGNFGQDDDFENERKVEVMSDSENRLDSMCGLRGLKKEVCDSDELSSRSLKGTPRKINLRRQSLDVLWNNTAGEKVKEILSQSILKLNISTLTERKSVDSKMNDNDAGEDDTSVNSAKDMDGTYESNLSSQFGINFFSRKNSKADDDITQSSNGKKAGHPESISTNLGGFISRKERFSFKKVPSPLEKTLNYLNPDEESNSDNESLASSDMLTDDQLASLVLDRDLAEMYQDII